jgi:hypothetical protein
LLVSVSLGGFPGGAFFLGPPFLVGLVIVILVGHDRALRGGEPYLPDSGFKLSGGDRRGPRAYGGIHNRAIRGDDHRLVGSLARKPLDHLVSFLPAPGIDDFDAPLPITFLLWSAAKPAVKDDGNAVSLGFSVPGQQVNQRLSSGFQALTFMETQHVRLPDKVITINDDVHTQTGLQESGFRHRARKNMFRPVAFSLLPYHTPLDRQLQDAFDAYVALPDR